MKNYVIRLGDAYYTGKYKTRYYYSEKGSGMVRNPVCVEKGGAKRYNYIMATIAIWLMRDTCLARLYTPKISKVN